MSRFRGACATIGVLLVFGAGVLLGFHACEARTAAANSPPSVSAEERAIAWFRAEQVEQFPPPSAQTDTNVKIDGTVGGERVLLIRRHTHAELERAMDIVFGSEGMHGLEEKSRAYRFVISQGLAALPMLSKYMWDDTPLDFAVARILLPDRLYHDVSENALWLGGTKQELAIIAASRICGMESSMLATTDRSELKLVAFRCWPWEQLNLRRQRVASDVPVERKWLDDIFWDAVVERASPFRGDPQSLKDEWIAVQIGPVQDGTNIR